MRKAAVLVVDDEPDVRHTLSAVLTLVGFKAYCAASVEEALGALAREHIDAVSLDIRMPDLQGLGRDGISLLKHLRNSPAHIDLPVLLFTGVPLTPDEEALVIELQGKVFYKPQPYAAIIEELRRVLPIALRPPAA